MQDDSLHVYVNQKPTGTLAREDREYVFNYERGAEDLVSLTMPIRAQSWTNPQLHPVFQMNLPEGALREAIRERFAKIETMDDMGFLRIIGPYLLGRVKFETVATTKSAMSLSELLRSPREDLFDELMERFALHSGVSGVQPKLLLSAENKTTMTFEHYIVKSWDKEYEELALNEYFCMRAIAHAGLETPEFYLSDNRSLFVMKRFDIMEDGRYLGFEDMCVLTGRGTDAKYDGSYEEIARVIKDVIAPPFRKEALRTLFAAVVMNHFLKNGDGHLKNYGILYENDYTDARLAPVYDVITTTVYIQKDIPALKLGDSKRWWGEKSYKNFAKLSCGLSNREYDEILKKCTDAIRLTRQEIEGFEAPEARDFLHRLQEAWGDRLS